jgi:hypothetical protein
MNILPFTARVTKSSPQISADERQFELRLDIALSRDQRSSRNQRRSFNSAILWPKSPQSFSLETTLGNN